MSEKAPQLHIAQISASKLTPAYGFLHSRAILSPLSKSLVFTLLFVQLREYQAVQLHRTSCCSLAKTKI